MNFKIKAKSFFKFACLVIGAIAIARFCHHKTQGFQITKIQPNLIETSTLVSSSDEQREFLNALFQQKFSFFGRGLQSFVFASQDGQYVVKVFNNRYQQKIALFSFLSHFPWIGHFAKERATYYRDKLTKTFNSYQIAFDEMKDKTGLIYAHLFPSSDLSGHLTLIDKLNIVHRLDPNKMGFVVQKRVTLVFPALKEYVNKNDLDGAKHAISSLIHLFFWKWQRGIVDNDPLIRTNYGFVEGNALQIDVGPLSKGAFLLSSDQKREEILRITASLKFWLTENSPELIPFLERELQQQLSSEE